MIGNGRFLPPSPAGHNNQLRSEQNKRIRLSKLVDKLMEPTASNRNINNNLILNSNFNTKNLNSSLFGDQSLGNAPEISVISYTTSSSTPSPADMEMYSPGMSGITCTVTYSTPSPVTISTSALTPDSSPASNIDQPRTIYSPETKAQNLCNYFNLIQFDQLNWLDSRFTKMGSILPPQEVPLDLSMKSIKYKKSNIRGSRGSVSGKKSKSVSIAPLGFLHTQGSLTVPIVKGDVASSTTAKSVASRYNLVVSPVVEEMPAGVDMAYVCPICGQMFSLHDRLAKHMASRHRGSGQPRPTIRNYQCPECPRSFARSDMLTRHSRLHSGYKPYNCDCCPQVFSRSDHLATHLRTHTGEKPYRCSQCAYSACRRDMITRHLRTHARSEALATSSVSDATNASIITTPIKQ